MTTKLANGEILWVTDQKKLYIGDGTTASSSLVPVTGFNAEDAVDSVGAALVAGTNTNITFTYGATQDAAGRIDAAVDLSNYVGVIQADAFKGSVFADTSTTMIDSLTGTFNLDGTIGTNLVPNSTGTIDVGTTSYRFRDVYLSGSSSLYFGSAAITAAGTGVNLPAGSTIDGAPIGGTGAGGSLNVDIVGDDSTILVNSSTNTHRGNFVGDLKGSVVGDDSTVIIDGVSNRVVGTVIGNVTTSAGSPVITTSTKTATLNEIALEGSGIVSGNALTVTALGTVFATQTGGGSTPFVSVLTATSASAASASMVGARARGSLISPSAVTLNDELGKYEFSGHDGSDYRLSAGIIGKVDGTVSSTIVPSRMELYVKDSAGSLVTPVTVKATQVQFSVAPMVPTYADATARDAAISAPAAGMIVYISGTAKFQGYTTTWTDLN
jgi:hypothetical protein